MQERQSLAEGTVRARGLAGEVDEVTRAQSTSHCTSVARLHVVAVTPVNAVNTCREAREKSIHTPLLLINVEIKGEFHSIYEQLLQAVYFTSRQSEILYGSTFHHFLYVLNGLKNPFSRLSCYVGKR